MPGAAFSTQHDFLVCDSPCENIPTEPSANLFLNSLLHRNRTELL